MGHDAVAVDARGFTLLELVVTLFVLGLAVTVVMPAIGRTSDTLRTRAEVARFAAMLRHAREEAITTTKPQRVVVSPPDRRVTLIAGEDDVRETRVLPPTFEIRPVGGPGALTVRFEAQGVSTGGDFRFVSGRTVYRVIIDPLTGRVRSVRE